MISLIWIIVFKIQFGLEEIHHGVTAKEKSEAQLELR